MEIIARLGSLLGLSFISGINLYATVAVVGICTKYQLVQGLPPELDALASDPVIFVAVLLYMVEFLADKVPGFDTLWDALHTLIRPLGGAMLAVIQVGESSPATQVIAFMVGASLAAAAHVTKAGTRLIINTSPEPFSNILVSLTEDAWAIGFSYLTLAHPTLSFFLTLACLVLIGFLMPLILRTFRMIFSALLFRVKCFFSREAAWSASRYLPFSFDTVFDQHKAADEKLIWTGRAYAIKAPGFSRFTSTQVVLTSKAIHCLYRRRFHTLIRTFPIEEFLQHKSYPGFLLSRWLWRTSKGDWVFYLYQPLSRTFPQDLRSRADVHEKSQ